MIPHAGITHASGWIIIKKIQVAITQEVSTIRNNLIFANNGLGAVVFIFIVMFSLLFMQDSDFVWKTWLSCNSWGIKFSQFPSCIYLC